jgi:hypothetical protein
MAVDGADSSGCAQMAQGPQEDPCPWGECLAKKKKKKTAKSTKPLF